jgi:hypothetical protein
MTSSGKQNFISPYNNVHKLFIIPKLHMLRLCSEFSVMFRLCSAFFSQCSEFSVMYRIAQKLVCSEYLDFVVRDT